MRPSGLAIVTWKVARRGCVCGRCLRPIRAGVEHVVVAGDPICQLCVEPEEAARASGGAVGQGALFGEAS